jgi:hypothetical protein
MRTRAIATIEGKSWEERPYDEREGVKLARASVVQTYHGDIEGEARLEYLMAYRVDGAASFVGLERVVGRIGGRSGSFVLQSSGGWQDGTARAEQFVVPGSGTGELHGLRGEGSYEATHTEHPTTLDYWFE